MLGRINAGDARVVPLKTQTIGGDRPVEVMQRRKIDRAYRIGSEPLHGAAFHICLMRRWHPVRRGVNAIAQLLHPRMNGNRRVRLGAGVARQRPRSRRPCPR